MAHPEKNAPETTDLMHPRNPHGGRYDFDALCRARPELMPHLRDNPAGDRTIDFADPEAVLYLNRALLAHHYGIQHWLIPPGNLCPPVPGRADVIHHVADLLARDANGEVPTGPRVRVLDIGTGANCIYPILGSQSYGWKMVGTDTDPTAVKTARAIVAANPCLTPRVKIVQQRRPDAIYFGVIGKNDRFDLTLCNPPFFDSPEEANSAAQRKVQHLAKGKPASNALNFGGRPNELWCDGGELAFITRMVEESTAFAAQVGWFTTSVSKSANLPQLKQRLARVHGRQIEVIPIAHGHKRSRVLAWKFGN